ncbi:phosphatidylglycerophosphatase A family protein [Sinisalibacter aestuarii]|uniref:Phosphatidylglycerophosphatase A n=1 Tax=Sinisalibacter aestuarii TaxID=2949426 RepID=A0ABQ5LVK5_9RHOB|nr:phosphatidylglycerophosphatase A [Sinisalibacter aestuarii]GKY89011.1 phosphatidylglycerophosphatase A [Sinisalibacter aestuarii]
MNKLIATFFGAGLLKPAPGTWGSLAALPFVWLLHVLGGPWLFGVAIVAVFLIGWWATRGYTAMTGVEDPSEVVIDEVVGMWIAMLPVSIGAAAAGAGIFALYPGWIAAFFLFRFFDIVKMGPVRWADDRGDAMGVMLDDVFAGIFAAIVVIALAGFSHLVLM